MKKIVFLLCSVFLLVNCDKLNQIPGDSIGLQSDHQSIRPLYAEFDSIHSIKVVFDNSINDAVSELSNFSLSGGGIVLLSASPQSSNAISLYVSNQSPTETYTLTVQGKQILILIDDVSQDAQPDGGLADNRVITNTLNLIGGDLMLYGYGYNDQTAPVLEIFSPTFKVSLNRARNEPLQIFGFARDDSETQRIEYKIDSGSYVQVSDVNMSINVDHLSYGDHQLLVRVTDVRGNSTVAQVEFNVFYSVTSFDIVEPSLRAVFMPGGSFTVTPTMSSNSLI